MNLKLSLLLIITMVSFDKNIIKDKKVIGVVVVAVLIIVAGGLFWWQYGGSSEPELEVDTPKVESNLKQELDFLDSKMVENRGRYFNFPIELPEGGRDNPFEPF